MNKIDLSLELYRIQAIKFGSFLLKSGIVSPIYIDLRLLVSYPKLLQAIAEAMWRTLSSKSFDRICGVPYTALPIATCMSIQQDIPMVMRRKEQKNYGTKQLIEGAYQPGQNCLVVEDLITSGASVLETVEPLQDSGLVVTDVVLLIDREQGGKLNLEKRGFRVHSVLKITELLSILHERNLITPPVYNEVIQFIEGGIHAC